MRRTPAGEGTSDLRTVQQDRALHRLLGVRTAAAVGRGGGGGSTATQDVAPSDVAPGSAGASARREHERRRSNDEKRLRERWGRLGGLAVALSSEPQSTAAWSKGAVGEERVGRMLDDLIDRGVLALHDRRVPGSRANIDHLAVTAGGSG